MIPGVSNQPGDPSNTNYDHELCFSLSREGVQRRWRGDNFPFLTLDHGRRSKKQKTLMISYSSISELLHDTIEEGLIEKKLEVTRQAIISRSRGCLTADQ